MHRNNPVSSLFAVIALYAALLGASTAQASTISLDANVRRHK